MPFYKRVATGEYYYSEMILEPPMFVEVTQEEAEGGSNTGPPALVVPQEITMRQFRLGLLEIGFYRIIDLAIKREDSYEGKVLQIEWGYADSVQRESDFVTTVCSFASMSDDEINQAFIAGGAL